MSQRCALAAKAADGIPGCIRTGLPAGQGRRIPPLCSTLVRPRLERGVRFWAPQYRRDTGHTGESSKGSLTWTVLLILYNKSVMGLINYSVSVVRMVAHSACFCTDHRYSRASRDNSFPFHHTLRKREYSPCTVICIWERKLFMAYYIIKKTFYC